MYHQSKIDVMKDTENIYYLGRVLVDRPYRMIRHLLLMSLICFLAFQNVYGSFNKEGFLYAYLVSVFIFSFPIYMNIYQLLPRFLGKRQFIFIGHPFWGLFFLVHYWGWFVFIHFTGNTVSVNSVCRTGSLFHSGVSFTPYLY